MVAQIIGATVCWAAVFIVAWLLEYSRVYAVWSTPERSFFVWLTGLASAMFGTMLTLANLESIVGIIVLSLILAAASWRSSTFRDYMKMVLFMAVPGGIVGGIVGILMLLSN